jgi:hypothetical protein
MGRSFECVGTLWNAGLRAVSSLGIVGILLGLLPSCCPPIGIALSWRPAIQPPGDVAYVRG